MRSPYKWKISAYYYMRKRIPKELQTLAGKTVIKNPPGTKDPNEAKRQALSVVA